MLKSQKLNHWPFINWKFHYEILSKIAIETTPEMVKKVYDKLEKNISKFRITLKRPLTLTEKILSGHLEDEFLDKLLDKKNNYVFLRPDRVA